MKQNNDIIYNIYASIRNKKGIYFINDDKLMKLVQSWINYFFYISENMKRLNLNIDNFDRIAVKRSIFYSVNVYDGEPKKTLVKKENKLISILFYIINILIPYRSNKGLIQGGLSGSLYDIVKFTHLSIKIKYAKISVDKDFKLKFFEQAKNQLNSYDYTILVELMPDIFFVRKLIGNYYFPIDLKGAPNSFLDNNYNYIKLLLVDKKVFLSGIQHGGAYGEWIDNPHQKYEESISDLFYGWGLLENNISQNRFHKFKKNNNKNDKIYWIGRDGSKFISTDCWKSDLSENHFNDTSHIYYFAKVFSNNNIIFRGHPRNGNLVYKDISLFNTDIRSSINQSNSTDDLIQNCKLVIFDCLSQTLLYECICFQIPFIILLSKFPVDGLSENALLFYELLRKNNILITMDECISNNSKLDFIKSYLDGNQKEFFSDEIIKYFEQKFILEKTIKDI